MEPADPTEQIRTVYRRFGAVEAAQRSPVYAQVAEHICTSTPALEILAALPAEKRQPNLFLGAVQYLRGPLTDVDAFDAAVAEQGSEITDVVLCRTTQTNIPARCATLLPALAQLPQPLALIEVGASAGLCLYPDRYAYDFDGVRVPACGTADAPVLSCRVGGPVPVPRLPVDVAWRAGLDLAPLDVADRDDRAWLEALVWPGEEHLRHQLRAAMRIARADPPHLVAGDLTEDLPALVARAPDAATVVVFHSAVLAYVPPDRREHFARTVRDLGVTWLANEAPRCIPGRPADVLGKHPPDRFLLCQDAAPLAWTDPHGAALTWLPAR